MSIEPRLMERRRTVAEDNAKRNVGRLLKFLAAVLVAGAVVWLIFSPWLSVRQVDTSGIAVSTANSILADRGVVAGTPMIRISVAGTEAALLQDPWISEADVVLDWPDRIDVAIVERTPVAWTNTGDGWTRRAIDGVALPSGSDRDPEMAAVDMPELTADEAATDPAMLGALQFVDNLSPDLRPGTVVYHRDGEVWATVAGYEVRLGRGVEMAAKALSLQALLEEDLPDDAVLTLIAPTNPSHSNPGTGDELGSEGGSEEVEGEGSTEGMGEDVAETDD